MIITVTMKCPDAVGDAIAEALSKCPHGDSSESDLRNRCSRWIKWGLLEQLVEINDKVRSLKGVVIDKLINEGAGWQDIARHDKIQAIMLCKKINNMQLAEAKKLVEAYLIINKGKIK